MMPSVKQVPILLVTLLPVVVSLVCLPGDKGCVKCQATCDAIPLAQLPECCEAFSTCCPTYSSKCGQCSANAAIDSHFPEYCCASFTDCCHLVPGLNIVGEFSAKQGSKITPKNQESQSSTSGSKRLPSAQTLQNSGRESPRVAVETPRSASRSSAPSRSRQSVSSSRTSPTNTQNTNRQGRVTSRGRVVK